MRTPLIAAVLALGACQATDPPVRLADPPEVAIAVEAPAGAVFAPTVARGLADEPRWRACRAWWFEALAQTPRFAIVSSRDRPDAASLQLTVDAAGRALTATLVDAAGERVLAAGSFAPDSETPTLTAAIDRLAWAARLALGERPEPPQPVARITSRDPEVVARVEDARLLVETGAFAGAHRTLIDARRRDGGAPYVLAPLASLELLRNDAAAAEGIAREALGYAPRVSPTVQHQLARTLLMARAASSPGEARSYDRELAVLAEVAARERPHDDEPRWTRALAHNFRAEFRSARELLEQLHQHQPSRAFVSYHLGWACLGLGDAEAAAHHLEQAALRLPAPWVLLPRAIALYEAGRHDELEDVLDRIRVDLAVGDDGPLTHQVLRIQAAHALLQGDVARARARIVDDLHYLLKHPLLLEARVGDFAESGAVLVRLGGAPDLTALLAAVQQRHPGSAVADASAFVGALDQVRRTGARAEAAEGTLGRDGESAFAALLKAYGHELRGEVGDMQNALARTARLSDSPLTKALVAKSLRAVGKDEEADRLQDTLRREMVRVRLRERCQHPVFAPELAYSFVLR